MKSLFVVLSLLALALTACGADAELAGRVADLESSVATLEALVQAPVADAQPQADATSQPPTEEPTVAPAPTQAADVDYLAYQDLDAVLAIIPQDFLGIMSIESLHSLTLQEQDNKLSILLLYSERAPADAIDMFAADHGSQAEFLDHEQGGSPYWGVELPQGLKAGFLQIDPGVWYDGYKEMDEPGMALTITDLVGDTFDFSSWWATPLFDLSTYSLPDVLIDQDPLARAYTLTNEDGQLKMSTSVDFGSLDESARRVVMKSYVFVLQGSDWYADEIFEDSTGFVFGRLDEKRTAQVKMFYGDDGLGLARLTMFYLNSTEE